MKKFKIGLDVHGVIDRHPELFAFISQALVAAGAEVHIITGPEHSAEFEKQIRDWGIAFTNFCGIVDYCAAKGIEVTWDERGHGWVREEAWDTAKAEYCAVNGIDLHIDDSETYGRHFTTPYLQLLRKTR